MKKLLLGIFAIAMALGVVACNDTSEEIVEFNDEEQVFTLQAVSAASLLDYSFIDQLSFVPLSSTSETTELEEEEVIIEEIDEVDQYLEMMESFLGSNNGLGVTVLESDREAYEFMISFLTVDVLGNELEYFMYYNETVYEEDIEDDQTTTTEAETTTVVTTESETTVAPTTESETTAQETSSQDRQFNFQDEDDDNVVYLLTGIIVQGENEYNLEGKRIVGDDGAEMFRLRSYVDSENCVKVTYMTDAEDGNKKFFYEVKQDNVIISRSRVHVVEEDGALRVHLDFADLTQRAKYDFKVIEEEGVTLIHVRYDIKPVDGVRETGNIHIEVTLDPETGETIYTYRILEAQQNGQINRYKAEIEKKHDRSSRFSNQSDNGNGNNEM
ncbi:MAG: hypothetical protein KAU02_04415 [Tenericutes bacterium]|nr:hypothetical protein [Mycoplasmatota bacterium]